MNRLLAILAVASVGMFPFASVGHQDGDGAGYDHRQLCHPNNTTSYTADCHPELKPTAKKKDDDDEWVIASAVVSLGVVGWMAYKASTDNDLFRFLPKNLRFVPQIEEDGDASMLIEYSLDASSTFSVRAHSSWNNRDDSTLGAYWRFGF